MTPRSTFRRRDVAEQHPQRYRATSLLQPGKDFVPLGYLRYLQKLQRLDSQRVAKIEAIEKAYQTQLQQLQRKLNTHGPYRFFTIIAMPSTENIAPHQVGLFTTLEEAQRHIPYTGQSYNIAAGIIWKYVPAPKQIDTLTIAELVTLNTVPENFPYQD